MCVCVQTDCGNAIWFDSLFSISSTRHYPNDLLTTQVLIPYFSSVDPINLWPNLPLSLYISYRGRWPLAILNLPNHLQNHDFLLLPLVRRPSHLLNPPFLHQLTSCPLFSGLLVLLTGSFILSILPQIYSLSLLCTSPNHHSLASLTLSTEHLACTVTPKYAFLILSIHITAKTSLWRPSLLPVCCYLSHTHCSFLHHLMIMFSHSFSPPLPSQVLWRFFPIKRCFLTNVACSDIRVWASISHCQITFTPPDSILIKSNLRVELNRFHIWDSLILTKTPADSGSCGSYILSRPCPPSHTGRDGHTQVFHIYDKVI